MKRILSLVLFIAIFGLVGGYYRSSGTYVSPYYRTSPNRSFYDNYSYKGNYNPYSGNYGTKSYSPLFKSYRSYWK